MHPTKKSLLFVLTAATSLAMASTAMAGCGDIAIERPASWDGQSNSSLLLNADYESPSIVGLWEFKFIAGGHTIDFGYVQWHSDGTEFMNSGGRAPATQNFCLGVWKSTGPSRYHLNHFALSYDTAGVLNAKINIKEDVYVDSKGQTYSGPFTIDVYDPNSGALLQHVGGQVTAKRLTAN